MRFLRCISFSKSGSRYEDQDSTLKERVCDLEDSGEALFVAITTRVRVLDMVVDGIVVDLDACEC